MGTLESGSLTTLNSTDVQFENLCHLSTTPSSGYAVINLKRNVQTIIGQSGIPLHYMIC